jgi:hypothetical protein
MFQRALDIVLMKSFQKPHAKVLITRNSRNFRNSTHVFSLASTAHYIAHSRMFLNAKITQYENDLFPTCYRQGSYVFSRDEQLLHPLLLKDVQKRLLVRINKSVREHLPCVFLDGVAASHHPLPEILRYNESFLSACLVVHYVFSRSKLLTVATHEENQIRHHQFHEQNSDQRSAMFLSASTPFDHNLGARKAPKHSHDLSLS